MFLLFPAINNISLEKKKNPEKLSSPVVHRVPAGCGQQATVIFLFINKRRCHPSTGHTPNFSYFS
jgi:hypothetical protein